MLWARVPREDNEKVQEAWEGYQAGLFREVADGRDVPELIPLVLALDTREHNEHRRSILFDLVEVEEDFLGDTRNFYRSPRHLRVARLPAS